MGGLLTLPSTNPSPLIWLGTDRNEGLADTEECVIHEADDENLTTDQQRFLHRFQTIAKDYTMQISVEKTESRDISK